MNVEALIVNKRKLTVDSQFLTKKSVLDPHFDDCMVFIVNKAFQNIFQILILTSCAETITFTKWHFKTMYLVTSNMANFVKVDNFHRSSEFFAS